MQPTKRTPNLDDADCRQHAAPIDISRFHRFAVDETGEHLEIAPVRWEEHVHGYARRIGKLHWLGAVLFSQRIDAGLFNQLYRFLEFGRIAEEGTPEYEMLLVRER